MIRMMIKLIKVMTMAMLVAWATACGSRHDTGPDVITPPPQPIVIVGPLPPKSTLSCDSGTQLTYENFGEGFLLNYCTACHSVNLPDGKRNGAPLGQDFDTAADVTYWRAQMTTDLTATPPTMPPSANVPAADMALAKEWLQCGAPGSGAPPRIK